MNITARTCANCAAFNPKHAVDQPGCWNLVSFAVSPGQSREPSPTDACDGQQTHQEDAEETAYIETNRDAIWDNIRATVATQELLGKFRKGGNP